MSDPIIAAYILVAAAAIIFTIRRRTFLVKTVVLLVGLAVLGNSIDSEETPHHARAPPAHLRSHLPKMSHQVRRQQSCGWLA